MPGAIVVIGGGITGLAAAQRVAGQLGPGSVTIVEGADRLGGKIMTAGADGFVLEGGPDCFLASKPAGLALCDQLGLAARIIETNGALRRSFVKRDSHLFPLPDGITGLVPSRLMPLITTRILSVRGRVRAALEPFVPRSHNEADESVGAFIRRRFGDEAWNWLVEPLLSGIYAGDGDALSLGATFPQLREAERTNGSVLRPLLAARLFGSPAAAQRRGFVSLASGMQELVDSLVRGLAASDTAVGTPVSSVQRTGARYDVILGNGTMVSAPAVIVTAPAHKAATLLAGVDGQLGQDLAQIPFVSTATVAVAYRQGDVRATLPGFGYVSPRAEGGDIVACTWTSNKFPSRVPADRVLIRLFIGRAGRDAIVSAPDETLITLAKEELRRVHGITAEPLFTRVTRWPLGLPQYTLGHGARVARIFDRVAAHPGLFVAGASYRGVGIPDCIASGWSAADAAITYVRGVNAP